MTAGTAGMAAIGEAIERYAASVCNLDDLVFSSWSSRTAEAVAPDELRLFSDDQHSDRRFPFARFTEHTVVRWVESVRWSDRRAVWVPAQAVYVPYRAPDEPRIMPLITTGLAAAPTLERAVLHGLYEVLERDAVTISWLHRLPPRQLPPTEEHVSSAVARCLRHTSGRGFEARFYDLTLDLAVPAVLAVVTARERGGGEILGIGSACRSSLIEASDRAFLDAVQTIPYVRDQLRRHRDWIVREDFTDVDSFQKHAILYSRYPELRDRVGYLLGASGVPRELRPASRAVRPPGDPNDELKTVVDEVRRGGYTAYVVDLTTPDVRQLGMHVVRVVVPELQPLNADHRYRCLGCARLRQVVRDLGYHSLPDNPYPHPMS